MPGKSKLIHIFDSFEPHLTVANLNRAILFARDELAMSSSLGVTFDWQQNLIRDRRTR
jgi:hypothetical protein